MQNISIEQIYTDYSGKVMAYIRARIRNKADAEDLLSEVFEKIMKKIEGFDPETPLYWLWVVSYTPM